MEAPEAGVHQITIAPQALCTNPGRIYDEDGNLIGNGPGTVNVRVGPDNFKGYTWRVDVTCN